MTHYKQQQQFPQDYVEIAVADVSMMVFNTVQLRVFFLLSVFLSAFTYYTQKRNAV